MPPFGCLTIRRNSTPRKPRPIKIGSGSDSGPARNHQLDERVTIALYLRADIPCSAVDENGEMAVRYDGGVRLHNVSYVQRAEVIRIYLAWANATPTHYAFSLQFFDAEGNKALQFDDVIYRQVLTSYDIDASSLPAGTYSIQLIVYDYETGASQGRRSAEYGGTH